MPIRVKIDSQPLAKDKRIPLPISKMGRLSSKIRKAPQQSMLNKLLKTIKGLMEDKFLQSN